MTRVRKLLFACTALVAASATYAQESTLYVAWQGGSREKVMKDFVFPRFAAKHPGVKLQYVAGVSTEILAKLQAQRANQDIDVAVMDDGPMYQASAAGLCAKDSPTASKEDLYPIAKMPGANAIGIGVVATGLAYNTKVFKEKGWPAPTSWKDLEDPKFKGKLSLLSISNTYGVHTLLMAAKINGGSATNMDPGFKALSQRVSPNVQAWVQTAGNLSSAFQSGEIAMAVWGNGRTMALAATGFPIDFVYPKEGAVATLIGVCAVEKKTPHPLAKNFIQFLLTTDVQKALAEEEGLGPVNRATKVSDAAAKAIPLGDEKMNALVTLDWNEANKNRNTWTRRWMREVEK